MRERELGATTAVKADLLERFHKIKTAKPPDICAAIVRNYNPEGKIYLQECYQRAFMHVLYLGMDALHHRNDAEKEAARQVLAETWLVHGDCFLGMGGHAWVELPGSVIFDGVYQRFCNKRSYYTTQRVKVYQRFRPKSAFMLMQHLVDALPRVGEPPAENDLLSLCPRVVQFADRITFGWWSVWGFSMNPTRPLIVDEKTAAKLIKAKLKSDGRVPKK